MLGESRLAETAKKILQFSKADQTEVSLCGTQCHLTRFGENQIHHNVAHGDTEIRVRSLFGGKTSVVKGNDPSDDGVRKLLRIAKDLADVAEGGKGATPLPERAPIIPVDSFSERTSGYSPMERAEGVEKILRVARAKGLLAGGSFFTDTTETLIANSNGVEAYHRGTLASILCVAMTDDSSGLSSAVSFHVDDLDLEHVGREAIEKALMGRKPQSFQPGEYTVILEEMAVADLVTFLAMVGMNARSFQDGRSFMEDHIDQQVAGDNITIWDDGHDLRGIPASFDGEGVPKQKVMLIEKGIARGLVYDTRTAAREPGATSTGHALPAPSSYGPAAANLFMTPGSATRDEMISSTEKGILVSRFHYTNAVHPKKTVITGTTRDGTFLIENGKIAHPIEDLRFTQSILDAFSNTEALGREGKLVKSIWAPIGTHVPAAKIHNFRFTGTRSSSGNGVNDHA